MTVERGRFFADLDPRRLSIITPVGHYAGPVGRPRYVLRTLSSAPFKFAEAGD